MTVKVGTKFNASLMDGNPEWTVTEVAGKYCTATVGPDWPDAPNHEQAFLVTAVEAAVKWRAYMEGDAAKGENYFDSLTPGDVVHYHNGFGEYVRCTVTASRDLQPIALVGKWHAGHSDYHAAKVANGTGAWRPHYGNVYEAPGFVGPRGASADIDPRELEPLELELVEVVHGYEKFRVG